MIIPYPTWLLAAAPDARLLAGRVSRHEVRFIWLSTQSAVSGPPCFSVVVTAQQCRVMDHVVNWSWILEWFPEYISRQHRD